MTRKRRHRAGRGQPYDYEQAFNQQMENLSDLDARRTAAQGIRYAAKEIRAGTQLEVEIYPEFPKSKNPYIPTDTQRESQRRAQRNLNEKNSRKQCERILNANFGSGDLWATFTYTDDCMPASMDEALKNMQNFIRRLNYQRKKRGLKNARYVYVTEGTQEGRWHHHVVLDGDMDMDTVERLWIKGKRNQVRRLDADENGLTGMAKYITKERKKKSQKKWTPSKGLKKPAETVNHYKFTRKDIRDMAQDENCIEQKMLKWYARQGYVFTSAERRTNEINGGIYIYAKLRRPEPPPKERVIKRRAQRKKE